MNWNKIIYISLSIFLFVSCVPNRRVAYVQDTKPPTQQQIDNMYFIDEPEDDVIKPGDELYIKVTSADERQTNFNQSSSEAVRDPAVISYTVDNEGYVKLPYVGKLKLSGLNLIASSNFVEKELSQYLLYPYVFIKFVNNKVTILGEVNRPGVYVFNYKTVNILQAIGYANDITIFGDRRSVLLIREEGDYRAKYEIDLTSDDLLASDYYRVVSNDIIYVEPLKRKFWNMDTFPYSLLLSVASLTIVIMTFFITYTN
jgi:polysaccharide biosynthesis/export protein